MLSSYFSRCLDPRSSNHSRSRFQPLNPFRNWLTSLKIDDPDFARMLCQAIPAQCPFERDINFFALHLHIPALCKLNPFYDELVMLRFQALSFLADECGEDVTRFCQAASRLP
jgi:Mo-dependent nitrogenase C-terminus